MIFELPELSFDTSAFSPWLSAETFEYHYGKHHVGYVKKLNEAIGGTEFADKSLDEIIGSTRKKNKKIFNSAAQHFNHSFFWNCLSASSQKPGKIITKLIESDFGSLDALKAKFAEAAIGHFGSGWTWLVQGKDGKLDIIDTHDAESPVGSKQVPLLTIDVWEHAYYIDHRNDRGAYLKGFWEHVNWEFVGKNVK